MKHTIRAACHCHTGKIRKKNEDNFFFGGQCLAQEHNGLAHLIEIACSLENEACLAVFDGMGGENFGEMASFSAVKAMQQAQRVPADASVPETEYLDALIRTLNEAVLQAQRGCSRREWAQLWQACISGVAMSMLSTLETAVSIGYETENSCNFPWIIQTNGPRKSAENRL